MAEAHDGFRHLIDQARRGDSAAMGAMFERVRADIEREARRYLDARAHDRSTSDLVQEVFLRAWTKFAHFKGAVDDREAFLAFRGWILTIVRSCGTKPVKDRPSGPIVADPPGPEPTPSTPLQDRERRQVVLDAISRLPDQGERDVITLWYLNRQTVAEIAVALGLTYDEVRGVHRRAMKRLERLLAGMA